MMDFDYVDDCIYEGMKVFQKIGAVIGMLILLPLILCMLLVLLPAGIVGFAMKKMRGE
jgi:hypothetical protein